MNLAEKLHILANSAKYDASCASSGSRRGNRGGLGNAARTGICHTWSADGRCVSLLKILLSNHCIYDCAYCVNRSGNTQKRAALTPEEVVQLTMNFYRRNYIEGLFLSSGVMRSPDCTMELMIQAVRKLRMENGFHGYIHLKIIPGADPVLVAEAGRYTDRLSVNIELPSERSLACLAPHKTRQAIMKPMRQLSSLIRQEREEKRRFRTRPLFAPAGQSTQLIVGATPESDFDIIRLSEWLYQTVKLRRVYYSAYVPVSDDCRLPVLPGPPLLREHRLYQADWLLRFYGFSAGELLSDGTPSFDTDLDPKTSWALRNLGMFPVEVNRADYELLLRVPGLGVRSARRILRARRVHRLSLDDLRKLGVVMKRARYFVTADGKYGAPGRTAREDIEQALAACQVRKGEGNRQLSLYEGESMAGTKRAQEMTAVVTGEF